MRTAIALSSLAVVAALAPSSVAAEPRRIMNCGGMSRLADEPLMRSTAPRAPERPSTWC